MANLVELGADVSASVNGETPAFMAASQGNVSMLRLLAELGADLLSTRAQGIHDQSVMDAASNEDHETAVELLEEIGVASEEGSRGNVLAIRQSIQEGDLAPKFPRQWVPRMPVASWKELLAWTESSLVDARACYTALYLPTAGTAQTQTLTSVELWNRVIQLGTGELRRLVVSFLVYHKTETRRQLREFHGILRSYA